MNGEYLSIAQKPQPPENVFRILGKEYAKSLPWYAIPTVENPRIRMSERELIRDGARNAYDVVGDLLGHPILQGAIHSIDLFDGCLHKCDTCLADAALPKKMFDTMSYIDLMHDDQFLNMLNQDHVRYGSSGDISNHPDAAFILQETIEATKFLSPYFVKVYTNYRPRYAAVIDEFIDIANLYPDQFELIISLPYNRVDSVNVAFEEFVRERPEVFGTLPKPKKGLRSFFWHENVVGNIYIQDVRHIPHDPLMVGRVLDTFDNESTDDENRKTMQTRYDDQRGLVKVYLNAECLWLMMYVTQFESHTSRLFTPLTSENIGILSMLPYHPDFPTPPNWSGGKGRYRHVVDDEFYRTMIGKRNPKPNTIIQT